MPTPYAVSSDLVSAWPAKSLAVANYLDGALAAKSALAGATYTGTHNFTGATVTGVGGGLKYVGQVAAAASSSVIFNNVFTSANSYYRLVFSGTTSADIYLLIRMRAAGSDNTSANYLYGYVQGVSAGASSAAATGQTSANLTTVNTEGGHCSVDIYSPADAVATRFQSIGGKNTTTPFWVSYYGVHNVASAFDGMTIYTSSGTVTGTFRLYAYQQA